MKGSLCNFCESLIPYGVQSIYCYKNKDDNMNKGTVLTVKAPPTSSNISWY